MSGAGYFIAGFVNFHNTVFMPLQVIKVRKQITEHVAPIIATFIQKDLGPSQFVCREQSIDYNMKTLQNLQKSQQAEAKV